MQRREASSMAPRQRLRHSGPFAPVEWRCGVADLGEQVAPIKLHPAVGGPRDCQRLAADRHSRKSAGQLIDEQWRSRCGGIERAEKRQFGQPSGVEHHHIRQRAAGKAGQQLLMGTRPRDRLQIDIDARCSGERRQQHRRVLARCSDRPPSHASLGARSASGERRTACNFQHSPP